MMKARITATQKFLILFGSIFAAVGLILLFFGVLLGLVPLFPDDSRGITTATVTSVIPTHISYEVDGTQYDAWLNYRSTSFHPGTQLEVSYSLQNPNNVRSFAESWFLLFLFGGLGVLFAGIGLPCVIIAGNQYKRAKRVLTNGHQITAEIIGTDPNMSLRINGRHPWRIHCRGYLPITEKLMDFYSPDWMDDPSDLIKANAITTLPVHLDPKNPRINYVDDSQLRSD